MLRLKKEKEAAALAASASPVPSPTPSFASDATATEATAGSGAPAISLLGGAEGRKGTGAVSTRRRMKPGEIRIQKDITELDAGTVGKVTWPEPSDLTNMKLAVTPDKGLWAGAPFVFSIKVPDMYPHEPPKVLCETKIYHPNIDYEGHVCLNILRDEWKPIYDINTVIYGIIYLFYEPNPTDPLNHAAAALMRDNRASFESNVRSSLRGGRVDSISFPRLIMY